jgi:hypothetical protein
MKSIYKAGTGKIIYSTGRLGLPDNSLGIHFR